MIDPRATLLIAGCVLSGTLLVSQFYGEAEDGIAATPAVTVRTDDVRAGPRAQPARVDVLLATTLARPLFSPTRRPPEVAQTTASELTNKRLAGIVIEPDRRLAIFAVTGAKALTVAEGESVDGWRLEKITPTEIALAGPKGSRTLQPMPEPASAAQSRPQRGNAALRPSAQPRAPPAPPAQAAAIQPTVSPPRQQAPPDRGAAVQMAPSVSPNRAAPAQAAPGANAP